MPEPVSSRMARRKKRRNWRTAYADEPVRMVCKSCGRLVTIDGSVKALADANHRSLPCYGCGESLTRLASRCRG